MNTTKFCPDCKTQKDTNDFSKRRASLDGLQRLCKSCCNSVKQIARTRSDNYYAKAKARYENDPLYRASVINSALSKYYLVRAQVFAHYGQCCYECGFSDHKALSIDHLNGDGADHRRSIGKGSNFYRWLVKNNFPKGFQTLCMNCQWIKRFDELKYKSPEL